MISKDKVLNILMGVSACFALTIIHYLPLSFGLLIGCSVLGISHEVHQWYRNEEEPDALDALATASPGIVAFIALEATKWTR